MFFNKKIAFLPRCIERRTV